MKIKPTLIFPDDINYKMIIRHFGVDLVCYTQSVMPSPIGVFDLTKRVDVDYLLRQTPKLTVEYQILELYDPNNTDQQLGSWIKRKQARK